jgi:hypothetical protein
VSEAHDTPLVEAEGGRTTDPVRALALENAALISRLRGSQIPQHVGMAAAARALAVDLPRVLMAQVEVDLASGALAARWEAARARVAVEPAGKPGDPMLHAIVALLAEQARDAARYLAVRGDEWAADAYRLDGQAGALEAQSSRLLGAAAVGLHGAGI